MFIQRQADQKHAAKLILIKKHLAVQGRDREGGEGGHETKKQKRERDYPEVLPAVAKRAIATDADKQGDIKLQGKYLKCPNIVGSKQLCGAYCRNGVAYAKMLATGKCHRYYTTITDLSPKNKLIWFDHVASSDVLDFNIARITLQRQTEHGSAQPEYPMWN